jgi:FixJ family two-component response regulator
MKKHPQMETVFIIDDDIQTRQSLVALVRAMGRSVRDFSGADEFYRDYRPEARGCLILDVQLPVQSGLELYQQMLGEGKRLPVIFITANACVPTAVAAMKCGAIDFLEKPFDRRTLMERIEQALELDRKWRSDESRFARLEGQIARLSSRDRETLELILAGESNKSMASKLLLTERAVEMRRARLMRKLGARSLAELLEVVVTHRILAELRATAEQRCP